MIVRNQKSTYVYIVRRMVQVLNRWISKRLGLEICWIEGLDQRSVPPRSYLEKLMSGRIMIHFKRSQSPAVENYHSKKGF